MRHHEKNNAFGTSSVEGTFSTSRRGFLGGAAALVLAIGLDGRIAQAQDAARIERFEPNAFIRVDSKGFVEVVSSYLEMGQGTFTGLATLAAEELDVSLDQVSVVAAPADVSKYANPVFAGGGWVVQGTGGSSAMTGAWKQMREAAATARDLLLSAAANEWKVPKSELEVTNGVVSHASTNRSASYGEFIEAASHLPVPETVVVKQPDAFRLIGREGAKRLDLPEKVNGRAIYTQDIKLPDMLVAVVAHCPQLWGKVAKVDASKALAIKGVIDVVEFPGDDEVRAGVAVLAKNTWIAKIGRDALDIEWDTSEALTLSSQDIRKRFHALADSDGLVVALRGEVSDKAPVGGKIIEAAFDQPYLAHAALEPMNCAVQFQDGRCDIWNGEQWQTGDQTYTAKELGLRPEQVFIHQLYAGGSFGRRANPRSDFVRTAVRIARAAAGKNIRVPIKMVWMREDDMMAAQLRPLTVHKVKLALDANNKLVSWHHKIVGQSFMPKKPDDIDHQLVEGVEDMPYAIANLKVEQYNPQDITIPTQWFRSVGHTHTAVAVEAMIDEAASAAGIDPCTFRRELLAEQPRDLAVLDLVAEKSNWATPLEPGQPGDRRARGIALRPAFGSYLAQVAEITVHEDGSYSIDRMVCAIDCGRVINPDIVKAQMEGGIGFGLSFLRQEITFEGGRITQQNFNDYPILRMNGMPKVEVYLMPSDAPPSGVGEPGVPPAVPAVINAIAAATGVKVRSLPFRRVQGVS